MGSLDRQQTIGRLVAEVPVRARVFEKFGIDYCCGGHRPLSEVAAERGLDLEQLVRDVEAVEQGGEASASWLGASDEELIEHLLATHHAYLREELSALQELVHKVVRVHGETHRELHAVQEVYDALAGELDSHMMKEEQVLFPMIRRLNSGDPYAATHCGGIENPLRVMRMEHEDAGAALEQLRQLTRDYAVPEGACNSYRAMLARLEQLERDTHEHVHKEENILFPRLRK